VPWLGRVPPTTGAVDLTVGDADGGVAMGKTGESAVRAEAAGRGSKAALDRVSVSPAVIRSVPVKPKHHQMRDMGLLSGLTGNAENPPLGVRQ
jgi:hypothetical protein